MAARTQHKDINQAGGPATTGETSPLTGSYLLIVVGEPASTEHKELILQRISKGFLSWDTANNGCDLNSELQLVANQTPKEEPKTGEHLIQHVTENLVTEVLINVQVNTLRQCIKNLLTSYTRHKHIIHAGYAFSGSGSWVLQDGTYSYTDLVDTLLEGDVQWLFQQYANSISIHIHCASEGDWTTENLAKESATKFAQVSINPPDKCSMQPGATNFVAHISKFLKPQPLGDILEPSDVVGNIRFSRPTLYVFPGGQGDSALFGVNGFNMLVDGGFSRRACFWDFVRHLDRVDALLVTRLNNSNMSGVSSLLQRKATSEVYPHIGHVFCNIGECKKSSPDGLKDQNGLVIDLTEENDNLMHNLKQLNVVPQKCYRDPNLEPINLYHKVGHGKLDMYVVNPTKDSREVKEFLHQWNAQSQYKTKVKGQERELSIPLPNLMSICALLVWQPADPADSITRILFPGSSPQSKIFAGLEKLKHLDVLKHSICSENSMATIVQKKLQKVPLKTMKRESSPVTKKIEMKSTITKPMIKKEEKKFVSKVEEKRELKKMEKVEEKRDIKKDKLDEKKEIKKIEKIDIKKPEKKEVKKLDEKKEIKRLPLKKSEMAKTNGFGTPKPPVTNKIEVKPKVLKDASNKKAIDAKNIATKAATTAAKKEMVIKKSLPASPAKKIPITRKTPSPPSSAKAVTKPVKLPQVLPLENKVEDVNIDEQQEEKRSLDEKQSLEEEIRAEKDDIQTLDIDDSKSEDRTPPTERIEVAEAQKELAMQLEEKFPSKEQVESELDQELVRKFSLTELVCEPLQSLKDGKDKLEAKAAELKAEEDKVEIEAAELKNEKEKLEGETDELKNKKEKLEGETEELKNELGKLETGPEEIKNEELETQQLDIAPEVVRRVSLTDLVAEPFESLRNEKLKEAQDTQNISLTDLVFESTERKEQKAEVQDTGSISVVDVVAEPLEKLTDEKRRDSFETAKNLNETTEAKDDSKPEKGIMIENEEAEIAPPKISTAIEAFGADIREALMKTREMMLGGSVYIPSEVDQDIEKVEETPKTVIDQKKLDITVSDELVSVEKKAIDQYDKTKDIQEMEEISGTKIDIVPELNEVVDNNLENILPTDKCVEQEEEKLLQAEEAVQNTVETASSEVKEEIDSKIEIVPSEKIETEDKSDIEDLKNKTEKKIQVQNSENVSLTDLVAEPLEKLVDQKKRESLDAEKILDETVQISNGKLVTETPDDSVFGMIKKQTKAIDETSEKVELVSHVQELIQKKQEDVTVEVESEIKHEIEYPIKDEEKRSSITESILQAGIIEEKESHFPEEIITEEIIEKISADTALDTIIPKDKIQMESGIQEKTTEVGISAMSEELLDKIKEIQKKEINIQDIKVHIEEKPCRNIEKEQTIDAAGDICKPLTSFKDNLNDNIKEEVKSKERPTLDISDQASLPKEHIAEFDNQVLMETILPQQKIFIHHDYPKTPDEVADLPTDEEEAPAMFKTGEHVYSSDEDIDDENLEMDDAQEVKSLGALQEENDEEEQEQEEIKKEEQEQEEIKKEEQEQEEIKKEEQEQEEIKKEEQEQEEIKKEEKNAEKNSEIQQEKDEERQEEKGEERQEEKEEKNEERQKEKSEDRQEEKSEEKQEEKDEERQIERFVEEQEEEQAEAAAPVYATALNLTHAEVVTLSDNTSPTPPLSPKYSSDEIEKQSHEDKKTEESEEIDEEQIRSDMIKNVIKEVKKDSKSPEELIQEESITFVKQTVKQEELTSVVSQFIKDKNLADTIPVGKQEQIIEEAELSDLVLPPTAFALKEEDKKGQEIEDYIIKQKLFEPADPMTQSFYGDESIFQSTPQVSSIPKKHEIDDKPEFEGIPKVTSMSQLEQEQSSPINIVDSKKSFADDYSLETKTEPAGCLENVYTTVDGTTQRLDLLGTGVKKFDVDVKADRSSSRSSNGSTNVKALSSSSEDENDEIVIKMQVEETVTSHITKIEQGNKDDQHSDTEIIMTTKEISFQKESLIKTQIPEDIDKKEREISELDVCKDIRHVVAPDLLPTEKQQAEVHLSPESTSFMTNGHQTSIQHLLSSDQKQESQVEHTTFYTTSQTTLSTGPTFVETSPMMKKMLGESPDDEHDTRLVDNNQDNYKKTLVSSVVIEKSVSDQIPSSKVIMESSATYDYTYEKDVDRSSEEESYSEQSENSGKVETEVKGVTSQHFKTGDVEDIRTISPRIENGSRNGAKPPLVPHGGGQAIRWEEGAEWTAEGDADDEDEDDVQKGHTDEGIENQDWPPESKMHQYEHQSSGDSSPQGFEMESPEMRKTPFGYPQRPTLEERYLPDLKKHEPAHSSASSTQLSTPSSESGIVKDEKKTPLEDWGEPMGLPSPPPSAKDSKNHSPPSSKTESTPASPRRIMKNNKDLRPRRTESPKPEDLRRKLASTKTPTNYYYVDLAYIPHHGNPNYSNVEFFKRVRARYYVLSGINPSKEVLNSLLEAKQSWEDKNLEVTIIPTYDTDTLGYWVSINEDILNKNKIDLAPSASRCTINLQDHETSCSAYRLEF